MIAASAQQDPDEAPIFIGGTNGSGTRVYAHLLEAAGVFQGDETNYAFEPEVLIHYTRPLVPELIAQTGGPIYDPDSLSPDFRRSTEAWLRTVAEQIQAVRPSGYHRWGWKHPRNLFLVPLLNAVFPHSVFIHVIRDGRDMGLAKNRADFRVLSDVMNAPFDHRPAGAAGFWSSMNIEVANWCQAHMGRRYIASRFEDLCSDPRLELGRILDALDLEMTDKANQQCADFVRKPDSIGRWQTLEESEKASVQRAARDGLERFGYL